MSRPDWCPEDVWEKAVKMASEWEENPELIQHMAEDFAPALLSAKREGAGAMISEVERLLKFADTTFAADDAFLEALRQKAQEIGK